MEGLTWADVLQAPAVLAVLWVLWKVLEAERADRAARETAERELLREDINSRNALAAALATLKQAIENATKQRSQG